MPRTETITIRATEIPEVRALIEAAVAYKETWLKLQDGAVDDAEKWRDIAVMHGSRRHLFELLGGREVTLNDGQTDPNGWWCRCGQQHEWGVGACPNPVP